MIRTNLRSSMVSVVGGTKGVFLFFLCFALTSARSDPRNAYPSLGILVSGTESSIFAYDKTRGKVHSLESLRKVITAATGLHPTEIDVKDLKDRLLKRTDRKPIVILLTDESDQEKIALTKRALEGIPVTFVAIEITDDLPNTLDELGSSEHAGALLISEQTVESVAKHLSVEASSLDGLYAFSTSGDLVWRAVGDRDDLTELTIVAKTLVSVKSQISGKHPSTVRMKGPSLTSKKETRPTSSESPRSGSDRPTTGAIARVISCGVTSAPSEAPRALSALLQPQQNHGLIVNVWATWCPSCRAEMLDLAELRRQYGRMRYVGVLIQPHSGDLCSSVRDIVPAELRSMQYAAENVGLVTSRFFAADPATHIPEIELPLTLVYGADGQLLLRMNGSIAHDDRKKALVTAALRRAMSR